MKRSFKRLEGCVTRNSEIPLIFRIHSCDNSRNLNSIKVFYELLKPLPAAKIFVLSFISTCINCRPSLDGFRALGSRAYYILSVCGLFKPLVSESCVWIIYVYDFWPNGIQIGLRFSGSSHAHSANRTSLTLKEWECSYAWVKKHSDTQHECRNVKHWMSKIRCMLLSMRSRLGQWICVLDHWIISPIFTDTWPKDVSIHKRGSRIYDPWLSGSTIWHVMRGKVTGLFFLNAWDGARNGNRSMEVDLMILSAICSLVERWFQATHIMSGIAECGSYISTGKMIQQLVSIDQWLLKDCLFCWPLPMQKGKV